MNDDLHFLCKSLDLDFRSYMFVLLVFCVCSNGKKRGVISSDCSNSVDSTRIVGELKYFNFLYHVLSYRCVYIYEIKCFVVVPYRVQRVHHCVYDCVPHRWNGST
jgi:hypothetical protein